MEPTVGFGQEIVSPISSGAERTEPRRKGRLRGHSNLPGSFAGGSYVWGAVFYRIPISNKGRLQRDGTRKIQRKESVYFSWAAFVIWRGEVYLIKVSAGKKKLWKTERKK